MKAANPFTSCFRYGHAPGATPSASAWLWPLKVLLIGNGPFVPIALGIAGPLLRGQALHWLLWLGMECLGIYILLMNVALIRGMQTFF